MTASSTAASSAGASVKMLSWGWVSSTAASSASTGTAVNSMPAVRPAAIHCLIVISYSSWLQHSKLYNTKVVYNCQSHNAE